VILLTAAVADNIAIYFSRQIENCGTFYLEWERGDVDAPSEATSRALL